MKYLEKKFCPACGSSLKEFFENAHRRLRCDKCGYILYENPIPATALVIPNPANFSEILLVRRAIEPCKGQYSLPGGFLEIDESPEECAIREMKEETGLTGTIAWLLGVRNQPSPQYKTVLLVGYQMKIESGHLFASDDAAEVQFFHLDNHPPIAFAAHEWFVEQYRLLLKH